jgi:rare lipoprotein A
MKTAILAAIALAWLIASSSSSSSAEICEASHYGVRDGYHGRITASGARFNTCARDPDTVAHKSLPFG